MSIKFESRNYNEAYQVVVILGRDVERVALFGVELGGVKNDSDLAFQDNENLKIKYIF